MIVAGRQLDPEMREPLAHLAAVAGLPILAEPTSQIRCGPHDRSHVVSAYDRLLRDERFRDHVTRSGPALRRDADQQAAARLAVGSGADQIVVDPGAAGTSRPAGRRPCCAPTRPSWRRDGRRGWRRSARPGDLAGRGEGGPRAIDAELAEHDEPTEPGLQLALGAAHTRRRPRLHRLEHADPRPGGVPAVDRVGHPLPLQPRRQRHRRPRLLRHRRRPRERPTDDDRHRRPRPAPRPRRPRRPARRRDSGPDRRHRQRRRRHLPLPTPGSRRSRRGVRSPARHAARSRRRQGGRPVRPPAPPPRLASPTSPQRSPPAPA